MDELNFIGRKALSLRKTGGRTRGQATVWEEMLANRIRRRLEHRTWKELSKLNNSNLCKMNSADNKAPQNPQL